MKAMLVLEDGFSLEGQSFTGPCEIGGEIIFNTSMTGYQELLTDPSYYGQIICMTWPLIGNYGITKEDMESSKVYPTAFVVKECCKEPSNWRAIQSLPEFLKEHAVPGIEGIDTRALTTHIRMHGSMRAIISTYSHNISELVLKAKKLPQMEGQNLVQKVTPKEAWIWKDGIPQSVCLDKDNCFSWEKGKIPLVVYDYGIKWNIIRLLIEQGFDPLMVPSSFSINQIKCLNPKAVFLSNGPGDPNVLIDEVECIKGLIDLYPIAGICLGHQLLGKALGGFIHKLPFGHHGCNHPVKNLRTGCIEISSQNHGFCVDIKDIFDVEVTHINVNDGTLEGFAHKTKPIIAVQYHPEASPGPMDDQYFFSTFKEIVIKS